MAMSLVTQMLCASQAVEPSIGGVEWNVLTIGVLGGVTYGFGEDVGTIDSAPSLPAGTSLGAIYCGGLVGVATAISLTADAATMDFLAGKNLYINGYLMVDSSTEVPGTTWTPQDTSDPPDGITDTVTASLLLPPEAEGDPDFPGYPAIWVDDGSFVGPLFFEIK